jgi:hypothetical protein
MATISKLEQIWARSTTQLFAEENRAVAIFVAGRTSTQRQERPHDDHGKLPLREDCLSYRGRHAGKTYSVHCSFCSKRGALVAYYEPGQFQVTTPPTNDATYRWNTKLVAHHFCPECGCATFSDSPAFEPDGSWEEHPPNRCQCASVRRLRCGRCARRDYRRQKPLVADMQTLRLGALRLQRPNPALNRTGRHVPSTWRASARPAG